MSLSLNVKIALATLTTSLLIYSAPASAQAKGQKVFVSAREATRDLASAVKTNNDQELLEIFGPEGKELVSSGDPQEDKDGRQQFSQKYDEMHRVAQEPDGTVTLYIGAENWPFPIPLVEKSGKWHFDTAAGKQEVLFRRIGRNELSTIDVCHELVEAEKEHFAGAHPGEAGEYADKFSADQGSHDGLYHPVSGGEPEIGPLLADASADKTGQSESQPFHGYYYRILARQGSAAAGGAKDYTVDGKMTAGFAFIAFPAQYKSTGVMTFMVSQDGVVYQKNLGADTSKRARAIQDYNPDSSWQKAEEESQDSAK